MSAELVVGPKTRLRLDDQVCFALYTATNAVVRAYRPLLQGLGLTYPQYLVIMALWEEEDLTMSELAVRLHLPQHGLSPIVQRLLTAGWAERRQDPSDGRVVRVSLTATGRALEQAAAQIQHQVLCQTALTPDAHTRLRAELDALTSRLETHLP